MPPRDSTSSAVEFSDCVESIGVGLVSTTEAEALVPAPFIVVGAGAPVTPLVVRTSDCGGIAVDGGPAKAGSIVQIGVVIVPPDFTGDINTYTLFYYTSDVKLAHLFADSGVPAQHVGHLTYDLTDRRTARARAAAWHADAVNRRHGRESGARGLIRRQLVEWQRRRRGQNVHQRAGDCHRRRQPCAHDESRRYYLASSLGASRSAFR